MEGARDIGKIQEAEHQILDELQAELDRYDRIIEMTRTILIPVITTYDSPERTMVQPEEAPQHDYHNALLRLRQLNNRFEDLRSTIRL